MPRVRTALLLTATLAAFTLSACASDDDGGGSGAAAPKPSGHPTTSAPAQSPAPSPTAGSPTASAPAGTAPARTGHRSGRHKVGVLQPRLRTAADEHLLAADRLPTVGDGSWTVTETAPEDPVDAPAVGACQKTGLGTIGAVEATRRTFRAPGGARATQVVARFADPRSAWRAHRVLTAWRDDCEQRVSATRVGPLHPVTVASGVADSYRTAYAAPRSRRAGLGILRTGDTITLVEVTAPRDTYPHGWNPARVAVRRVARTF